MKIFCTTSLIEIFPFRVTIELTYKYIDPEFHMHKSFVSL